MAKVAGDELKARKSSDTIFVLGSGYSVRKVNDKQWEVIRKHDSIAFNWFAFHFFEPTFYLVREQANIRSRTGKGETVEGFFELIKKYENTFFIICDVSHHTPKAHRYHEDARMQKDRLVLRDDNKKRHGTKLHKYMDRSPVKHGLVHGTCTMYNVMHLVRYLAYKKIVFVGVDLYDSRYFWLKKHETRHTVKKKGKNYRYKHAISADVMRLVSRLKKFKTSMFVANKKSVLTKIIPYADISTFA